MNIIWPYAKMVWLPKARRLFLDEKGEVNIVATVVLIGIAIALALFFKDQIAEFMGGLFGKFGDATEDLTKKPTYTPK